MTALNEISSSQTPPRVIPTRLAEPLRLVAGRARFLAFARAAFKFLTLAAITWLVTVLILGWRVQVPSVVAIPLVVATWLIVLIAAFRLFRPVLKRTNLTTAAHMVDLALPDTQERISSAVELSQQKDAYRGSPELIACLIRQAEHHADCMNPAAVVSGRDVFRWFTAVTGLFIVWFLLLVLMTPNVLLGLRRTFAPWSAAAPLPAPILEVLPGDLTIAQGQTIPNGITVDIKPPEGLSLDTGKEIPRATLLQHFTATSAGLPIPDRISDMERTGPRSFRALVSDPIQQPFTYKVTAEGGPDIGSGESPTYTVVVQTSPAVSSMQIVYTYPAYTHIAPRTDPSREGAIDGLAGTRVRITVQPTQPVKVAKLAIEDAGKGSAAIDLVADAQSADAANPTRSAEFTLVKSSQYHIQLKNAEDRDNSDAQSRPITVRPDAPPQIGVTSPSANTTLKVRLDDTVPVRFLATDDFAVSKVEALIQVDDLPVMTLPIDIPPGEARVAEDWNMALPTLLDATPVRTAGKPPRRVYYQLRATDNRSAEFGGGQTALSARQTLDLDKNALPLAQKLDDVAAKDLSDAIRKASDKLGDAQKKLTDLQKQDTGRMLTEKTQPRVTEIQKDIIEARDQLARAADQAEATRLNNLAQQVRDVVNQPVHRAEEQIAGAQLASDQADSRRQSEEGVQRNVQEARDQLNQIAQALRQTANDQPLAQSLETLADQQRELADALSQTPDDPKLLEEQRQLQQKLDQLIKENPQLQKPAAAANQSKVDDLLKKLSQIEEDQQPLSDPLANQDTNSAADRRNDLAQRQDQLNKDIARYSQQQAESIRQAAIKTPEPTKLDPIVKDLQSDKLSKAAQEQKSAASQLDQAADKLEGQQKKFDDGSASRQKAAAQAAQTAKAAADFAKQAQQLAQQIQDAKNNNMSPNRPTDPANQQAGKLADDIKKEAQKLASNPAAKAQAAAASAAAEAAKNAARGGQADNAQQQVASAAQDLAQAAQAAQNAAGASPNNPQNNSLGQAADQARDLAEKQRNLANQTDRVAKAQDDAGQARNNAAATAEKQESLSNRLAEAARDAESLQQQTQGAAPDLSQKAGQAAQALEKSSQAERDAAQSTRGLDAPAAAGKQSQAADDLASAEESLGGKPRPRSIPNSPSPSPEMANGNPPPTPNQTPNSAQGQGQNPGQPQNSTPAQSGAQNPEQNPGQKSGQTAAQDPGQSQSRGRSGGQSPGQSLDGSPTASNSSNPGQSGGQTGGQQTGQSGGSANGQTPGESPSASASQSPSGSPTANSAGQPGSSSGAQPSAQANGQPSGQKGGQGAGQAGSGSKSAAQSVQSARTSQAQAAKGDPSAARQAADQLADAANQLMPNGSANTGTPGQASGQTQGSSAGGQSPGQGTPGGMPGQAGGATGAPGSPGAGGQGIPLTNNGRPVDPPKEVQEAGISPSEWAKLPPKIQDELLHSAQQSGPPGYRDMIKNYYSRISRLQNESETPR